MRMDIRIQQGTPFEHVCDLLVLPVAKGKGVKKMLDERLVTQIEADGFEGKFGEMACLPTYGFMKARRIMVVGMGERNALNPDLYRRLGGMVTKKARELKAKSVSISFFASTGDVSAREVAQTFSEGAHLASYGFHAYHKKNADKHAKHAVKSLTIWEESKSATSAMERGVIEAAILADAACLARDLVNTPSQDMHPQKMADVAKEVAALSKHVSIKMLDKDRMARLKMNAALAVGRGSIHDPVGIHIIYTSQDTDRKAQSVKRKKIAIVGKAVTFDSGGLSLKPADGMMTMKIDMAGAAAVIGLFQALPSLAPDVEVHGIFLAVENMPSGHAYRPGDVVRAMNGTTIEILNTDAEGRVVLADALSYAATLEPDVIIDLATLTGACVAALGEEIAGVMGTDRRLLDRLKLAADASGEAIWELPMPTSYEEHVKSKIADIKNVGAKGQAGAIAGAMFLKHFIPVGIPWAHLDIAGPSYAERETRADIPHGGTGFGVRLLMRYLQGL